MALPHATDVIFITQIPLMTIRAFEVMARLSTECEKMFLMKKKREREKRRKVVAREKTSLEHYSVS